MDAPVELEIYMGRFTSGPGGEGADVDLEILLHAEKNKNDGRLLFLQGRCYEAAEKYVELSANYEKVVETKNPEWINASQRRATLLRDQLDEPAKADQVMEAMVQSEPEKDEVYLCVDDTAWQEPRVILDTLSWRVPEPTLKRHAN